MRLRAVATSFDKRLRRGVADDKVSTCAGSSTAWLRMSGAPWTTAHPGRGWSSAEPSPATDGGVGRHMPHTPALVWSAMGSEGLHEPAERLDEATIDHHRALTSLVEELEAVDWYDQRVKATNDSSLADVLAHNRDEEKEHASMTLEWLRRRDPVLDRHLQTYLFTSEPIIEVEAEAEAGGDAAASGSLGIGSLKGTD